jgi:hypothetical protein
LQLTLESSVPQPVLWIRIHNTGNWNIMNSYESTVPETFSQ